MKPLDILLIHPNSAVAVYQSLSREHSAIETPIWAGMLARHCLDLGFGAEIMDCEAEGFNDKTAAYLIKEMKPRIACFVVYGQQPSASSQNMEGAISLATELKLLDPTIKTLFVGGHVSALPLEVLKHNCVDFVCQNEGVYAIRGLLCSPCFNPSYYEKVRGLGWKSVRLEMNEPAPIVPQNMLPHDLPGIAWGLLPSPAKYRTAGWHSWSNGSVKSPFASLYTSLGCPFSCSFCMINVPFGGSSFRYWPPEHIIGEFDKLAEMGVKNVKIADEMFVLKEEHFMEVCRLLAERKHGFNIWAYSRVDTCKPRHLEALKKVGINWLGLGIESPDQMVRKDVVKGGYKEVKILDVIKSIQEAGINVGANYIFGLPKDTMETMQRTLDFAMSAKTEYANFYSAMCYPGSQLYQTAKEKGWTLPDRYAGWSQHSYWTQPLPTETLPAAEVLRFRDAVWQKYFTDPGYLGMLRGKFGQAAVDDVERSTKIKLKRKLLGD